MRAIWAFVLVLMVCLEANAQPVGRFECPPIIRPTLSDQYACQVKQQRLLIEVLKAIYASNSNLNYNNKSVAELVKVAGDRLNSGDTSAAGLLATIASHTSKAAGNLEYDNKSAAEYLRVTSDRLSSPRGESAALLLEQIRTRLHRDVDGRHTAELLNDIAELLKITNGRLIYDGQNVAETVLKAGGSRGAIQLQGAAIESFQDVNCASLSSDRCKERAKTDAMNFCSLRGYNRGEAFGVSLKSSLASMFYSAQSVVCS